MKRSTSVKIELSRDDTEKAIAFYVKAKMGIKHPCEIRGGSYESFSVEFDKDLWIYDGSKTYNKKKR